MNKSDIKTISFWLRSIFLPNSYDSFITKFRLLYLVVSIVCFFINNISSIFTYLAWIFLFAFVISIPLHFYERKKANQTIGGSKTSF